jgi:hypothetical protein
VITACLRERGSVMLSVERGQRRRRLGAREILRELQALVDRRGLAEFVRVREGCAGGCHGPGPNVSLTVHALPPPGRRPDHIAIGWWSYVGSLSSIESLAAILDEHLAAARSPEAPAGGARG